MSDNRCLSDGRCLAVITGANRGLGRAIAQQLYCHLAADSTLILTARDSNALHETRSQLLAKSAGREGGVEAGRPSPKVLCVTADLSSANCSDQLDELISAAKIAATPSGGDSENYRSLHYALLVHNAGSLGDVSLTADKHCSLNDLDQFFRLSLSSTIMLNSRLMQTLRPICREEFIIVNISSLCAIKPFPSMSLYCCAKAARDSFFAVLALENSSSGDGGSSASSGKQALDDEDAQGQCCVDVLSYSPGPLITDMTKIIAEKSANTEIRTNFARGRQSGFLTCEESAVRMMAVLKAKLYSSGQHVDYYDTDY